jgi:hypothetical protein
MSVIAVLPSLEKKNSLSYLEEDFAKLKTLMKKFTITKF